MENNNMLYMMLSTVHSLDDKILTDAFHILFGNDWKKNWSEYDKAMEMRAIFDDNTQPCRPFKNWVKCIEFLSLCCK